MRTGWTTAAILLWSVVAAPSLVLGANGDEAEKETNCENRIDDDGDSVTDCEDADCYDDPVYKTAGGLENTDVLCSDAIDNDSDDAVDCDDVDCLSSGLKACRGSWEGPLDGTGIANSGGSTGEAPLPELAEGQSLEDLIGTGSDIDGERNDFVCSDGMDNDGDGAVDCADIGCRFDPNVNVCRSSPGIRFTFAAHAQTSYEYCKGDQCADAATGDPRGSTYDIWDTRINRIQLRALGPVPFIQDSFFLISIRAERAPRLTFAMFSMPIAGGHYLNINSGGGGLSNGLVLSVSKNILLDPPFYLYSAFEAGNGAAVEVNGPLLYGTLDYRLFAAGGSGRFAGVVGGNFFDSEDRNFTYGFGGQLAYYALGRFDRWDTRFLYTPVARALTFYLGARYDQRDDERYPAANVSAMFRWGHFELIGEAYGKRELNFHTWQGAFNVQAGVLLVPKLLFLAGDVGAFTSTEFGPEVELTDELRRIVDEFQVRGALHTYVWRNTGVVTLLYAYRYREKSRTNGEDLFAHEVRVETQFRF